MDKDQAKQSEKEQMKWKVCKFASKKFCRSRGMFQNKEVLLKTQRKYEHSRVS